MDFDTGVAFCEAQGGHLAAPHQDGAIRDIAAWTSKVVPTDCWLIVRMGMGFWQQCVSAKRYKWQIIATEAGNDSTNEQIAEMRRIDFQILMVFSKVATFFSRLAASG